MLEINSTCWLSVVVAFVLFSFVVPFSTGFFVPLLGLAVDEVAVVVVDCFWFWRVVGFVELDVVVFVVLLLLSLFGVVLVFEDSTGSEVLVS